MKHQVRWMKSTRFSRPKGHFGTALTFAMPYALIAAFALLAMGHPGLAVLAISWAVGTRMAMAVVLDRMVLNGWSVLRTTLLYPLRDLMGFGFWAASYTSNRILWRGEQFELMQDGLMRPLRPVNAAGKAGKERAPVLSA
jgi:ceramide glucosyltransferase